MKIILTQEVKNLGHKGEVKDVANGYAINSLLPQKMAVMATAAALKEIEKGMEAQKQREEQKKAQALEIKAKLEGAEVSVMAKANEEGHLFGAVEEVEIIAALESKGLKLEGAKLEAREPIKTIGKHKVKIKIAPEVEAEITVEVKEGKEEKKLKEAKK